MEKNHATKKGASKTVSFLRLCETICLEREKEATGAKGERVEDGFVVVDAEVDEDGSESKL